MRGLYVAIVALGCGIGSASAGTKGGIYDFSYFLGQPHPLSGQQVGVGSGAPQPYPPAQPYTGVPYNPYGVTVAAAPAPAPVEPEPSLLDGWYLRAGGGYDLPDDIDDNGGGTSVNIDVDDGFMGEVAVGRYLGRNFRAELELAYRQTEFTDATAGGATATNISGDYTVMSAMVNGFYDLQFDFPIVPYVGVGIGAAQIEVDSVTVGAVTTRSDKATEFAYQGIVGLSWRFAEDFVATVDYRYFGTAGDNENATMTVAAGLRFDL
ncbi:MAG: outer membrane beta-barrel protein [Alphaproteobacteria bacterium]